MSFRDGNRPRDLRDERRRHRPGPIAATNPAGRSAIPPGRRTARRSPSRRNRDGNLRDLRDERRRLRTRRSCTNNAAARPGIPTGSRVPTAPAAGTCGNTVLQVNRATVEGNLEETAPGSGIFRAGPGDKVFVGGFELLPRIGGELLVDTNTNSLSEGGEGVSVFFGIFPVPLDVDLLPTNLPEAHALAEQGRHAAEGALLAADCRFDQGRVGGGRQGDQPGVRARGREARGRLRQLLGRGRARSRR